MATPKKKASKATKKATKKMRPGRGKKTAAGLTKIQVQFLDALRELGEIKSAAAAIGVARQQHYRNWLKKDAYRRAYDSAVADADAIRKDDVKAEVHKAGFEGLEETILEVEHALRPVAAADGTITEQMVVIRQKRRVVKKRSMSALLWEANLAWGNPARVEVTGINGGPLDMRVSVEAFRKLAGI